MLTPKSIIGESFCALCGEYTGWFSAGVWEGLEVAGAVYGDCGGLGGVSAPSSMSQEGWEGGTERVKRDADADEDTGCRSLSMVISIGRIGGML